MILTTIYITYLSKKMAIQMFLLAVLVKLTIVFVFDQAKSFTAAALALCNIAN